MEVYHILQVRLMQDLFDQGYGDRDVGLIFTLGQIRASPDCTGIYVVAGPVPRIMLRWGLRGHIAALLSIT
jgi:hypothetical protein